MTTNGAALTRVVDAEKTAIETMRKGGFDPGDSVSVSVDPRLPIMGYTHPEGKGYRIVVSGGAVESGMLEGLLLHELSHVYRMRAGHPSHNGKLVGQVVESLGKDILRRDYKQQIIYNLTNNIEDLYADDISIRMMREGGLVQPDLLSRFLQDWVSDEVAKGSDATKVRWSNSWTMANNARAIGQMARHGVEDLGGKAKDKNRHFLSLIDPSIANKFGYFLELLTNLREGVTDDEYKELLRGYLANFVEVAEGR